jgi:hypothetical protein
VGMGWGIKVEEFSWVDLGIEVGADVGIKLGAEVGMLKECVNGDENKVLISSRFCIY